MSGRSFGLLNVSDLLAKLDREYERFCSSEHSVKSDHAFNFAITAWHMTDWAWRAAAGKDGQAFGFEKFDHFHSHVRRECEALQVCYEIATGSKHFAIKPSKAKTVESTKTTGTGGGGVTRAVTRSITRPVVTSVTGSYPVQRLVINLKSGTSVPAKKVFKEALEYWHEFLRVAET